MLKDSKDIGFEGNKKIYNENLLRAKLAASRSSCIPENAADPHYFNRVMSRLRTGLQNLIDLEADFMRRYSALPVHHQHMVSNRHYVRFGDWIPIAKLL